MKRIEFIKSSIFSAFGLMLPKWKDSSKKNFPFKILHCWIHILRWR
ncbi:hypothetical protein [Stygiobacter electus]|uniref:Uncharacterized protein n=1 Tax=Stygiobacter electus TaxID=3032292 RepID=A0AAE3TCF0_9BACT|nr:hypothetical protein [Stygiobacter electus]MDF1612358.1 hypothetical protein [Stygiobacter electus]